MKPPFHRKRPSLKTASGYFSGALFLIWLSGCTAQPTLPGSTTSTTGAGDLQNQRTQSEALHGVRVSFHYSDYFTLANPNAQSCAGDARNFYDPLALHVPGQTEASVGFGLVSTFPELSSAAGYSGPTGPLRLPDDTSETVTQTIRPSFIKNISVDMTDANANVASNQALSCTLGQGPTVPATSSCATFDYGAIGGIPTSMGGSLLVIGGVQNNNFAGILPPSQQVSFPNRGLALSCGTVVSGSTASSGYTQCSSGVFALGVNTLPKSVYESAPGLIPAYPVSQGVDGPTGSISTWANISGTAGYTGPAASAGASAAYDPGLQQVLLFGGVAPLTNLGSNAPGVTTYDTWAFDLKSQQWNYLSANIYLNSKLTVLYDVLLDFESGGGSVQSNYTSVSQQIQKAVGARALFGYVPTPGMGMTLDQMGTAAAIAGNMTYSMIDPTDRIVVAGGYGASGAFTGTHRFNPTFGPEARTVMGNTSSINISGSAFTAITTGSANLPLQWIDSYHTQMMTNTYGALFTPPTTPAAAGLSVPFTQLSSRFTPDLPPIANGPVGGHMVINSAFAPISNNSSPVTGYVLGAGGFDISAPYNSPDTSIGDDASVASCTTNNTPTVAAAAGTAWGTNTDLRCGGGLSLLSRFYSSPSFAKANETNISNWSAVSNYLDPYGIPNTPAVWTQYKENPHAQDITSPSERSVIPFLGGASMVQGLSLLNNDISYFGGLNCRTYVEDSAATCQSNSLALSVAVQYSGNSSRYFRFGTDPAAGLRPSTTLNIPVDDVGTGYTGGAAPTLNGSTEAQIPRQAGMASARGLDPSGAIIILAWGGARGAAQVEGNGKIYYQSFGTVGAPNPKWDYANAAGGKVTGDDPAELINGAMVFSHITRKFYLFGGFEPATHLTRGDTYELTITSASNAKCVPGASAGTGNCTFNWKRLNISTGGGLTCYPTACPGARRSHRMAEVNYYNRNPGGTNPLIPALTLPSDLNFPADGEQPCTANRPCSYGIFMEGGTPDGLTYLSDRWMFDPTANGGNGHWQRVNEFPPRALASMTSVDFALPTNGQVVHRAVMFGGETGMHNAQISKQSDHYYVAPTLGDTWLYDYDAQTWNRAELLGRGYQNTANIPDQNSGTGTEFEHRMGYQLASLAPVKFDDTTVASYHDLGEAYAELSPPALSGAIMVTRTQAPPIGPASADTTPLRTLALPEVYMFGGRLKSGQYSPLDHVYKFCAGSTGEAFTFDGTHLTPPVTLSSSRPDPWDFACDAFDASTNPGSPNPGVGFAGRWITKIPDGTTSTGASITPSTLGSYLGAGAYDPVRDRIVLFGGLTAFGPLTSTAVTDEATRVANAQVYEYTPPQPQLGQARGTQPQSPTPREGRWTSVPACAGYPAPAGRYGHSLSFDTRTQSITVMGGYAANGTPLVSTINDQSTGTSYQTPEIWSGTYCTSSNCDSKLPVDQHIALTNTPCYYWQPITVFGNSTAIRAQLPPLTGLAHAASVYIPATGFNSGYYSMFDASCTNQGPIASPDPALNKLLAGGAYIDIDRTALGENENLLLNLTYLPMGTNNRNPDSSAVKTEQSAVFRVHLIKTGQARQQLEAQLQPRYMGYSDPQQFPQTVQSLSVMAPPTGQISQEQVIIPLSVDPGIDRIRIERYSGTGILLDAALYRMGSK